MDLNAATPEELVSRQNALENEVEANEEENRQLQAELDQIYAEQYRRRGCTDNRKAGVISKDTVRWLGVLLVVLVLFVGCLWVSEHMTDKIQSRFLIVACELFLVLLITLMAVFSQVWEDLARAMTRKETKERRSPRAAD